MFEAHPTLNCGEMEPIVSTLFKQFGAVWESMPDDGMHQAAFAVALVVSLGHVIGRHGEPELFDSNLLNATLMLKRAAAMANLDVIDTSDHRAGHA